VCVFTACGGVLGHGVVRLHKSVQKVQTHDVVRLHKSVQKVQTHVLQPVQDQADGMKWLFIF